MQDFLAGGVCFAEKQLVVDPYFPILAFMILVQLTILDEHLFLNKHGGKNINHPSVFIIIIMFYLLLYVAEIVKQSHTVRCGRLELSLLTWPGEPNTHVCEPSHPYNFSSFFPVQGFEAPSPNTESDHSAPVCPDKNKTYFYQEGARSFHSLVQSGEEGIYF